MARRSGGVLRFYKTMRTRNACKTCAVGMGGQRGGMVDESGRRWEVCKKSMQAMAGDIQGPIPSTLWEQTSLAELSRFSPRELESAGRLTEPLYAGPGDLRYRPIPWAEALQRCAGRFRDLPPHQTCFYVSGRSSNEAGFVLQLLARMYGTNNVNNCSYYCHQASGVGLGNTVGSGTATVVLDDLQHCDLFFLIGGNPASNHPRLMRQLMELRRRGGRVVVINPMREIGLINFKIPSDIRSLLFGSPIASLYVQPHIGGDPALLVGLAKGIIERGAVDKRFIAEHTDGWDALQRAVEDVSWKQVVEQSGVSRGHIDRVAEWYAESDRCVFGWTMGITHHRHGVDNVHAIANLALLRGMVGRPGAGLLPIRGHSNVQGIGSVGVTPGLKKAFLERLEQRFGVQLPTTPGMDTLSCMEAMHRGQLRAALCLGGNLYGANPDARWAGECLSRLDFIVHLSTKLNSGHVLGRAQETLVLPVLARDEELQPTTQESMFNWVRFSAGGIRRLEGPRGEVQVLAELAHGILGSEGAVDWSRLAAHGEVRELISAVVPGYEQIAALDSGGEEFQVAGRTLHEPRFATASGRAQFQPVTLPPARPSDGRIMLMTVRSEGQFNTVVYEEEDLYRGQERRDVILLNPADIQRLGLHVDQPVTVRSAVGEMKQIRVREFDIRAGNAAMYYPEANVLVPAAADPASRTPAFKAVPVTVHPELAVIQPV